MQSANHVYGPLAGTWKNGVDACMRQWESTVNIGSCPVLWDRWGRLANAARDELDAEVVGDMI